MSERTEKLQLISKLYPKERINYAKARIDELYEGKRQVCCTLVPPMNHYDASLRTAERIVDKTLDAIIKLAPFEHDYIPTVFPGCRQAAIPSMFGAKEVEAGGEYLPGRLLENFEQLSQLKDPQIAPGSCAHDIVEITEQAVRLTEGRIRYNVCDMQGPFDALGQICGYDEMFLAALTEPELFRSAVDSVTCAFDMLWEAERAVLPELFQSTHLWGWDYSPAGVSLSADSLVMISPDFFCEFYAPVLAHFTEKYGSFAIHSCGDFSAVIPKLLETPGLAAVNAGQMSVKELTDAGFDGRAVFLALCPYDRLTDTLEIIREHQLRAHLNIINYELPEGEDGKEQAKRLNEKLFNINK